MIELRERIWLAAGAAALLLALPALAQDGIPKKPIHFAKGATKATVQGTLKGGSDVDYIVQARAGQQMNVVLKASNGMNYFNVLPPGSEDAIFVGSTSGSRFEGKLPADGDYTIRVYLMRAAARRNESSKYSLSVSVVGAAPAAAAAPAGGSTGEPKPGPFDSKLELLGISFRVTSPGSATGNTVQVAPAGLEIDNSPMTREIDGLVVGAEVADLNVDQSPEIYVYVKSAGSRRLSLVAYGANRKKSLSRVYLPELSDSPGATATKGYRGHDDMAVVEGTLVRRFPIYGKGKDAEAPSGKTRQIQYKLRQGEAGWVLKVDKVLEY